MAAVKSITNKKKILLSFKWIHSLLIISRFLSFLMKTISRTCSNSSYTEEFLFPPFFPCDTCPLLLFHHSWIIEREKWMNVRGCGYIRAKQAEKAFLTLPFPEPNKGCQPQAACCISPVPSQPGQVLLPSSVFPA